MNRALVRTYLYGIELKLLAAVRRRHRDADSHTEPSAAPRPDEALWVREAQDRLDANDREILMLRGYGPKRSWRISTANSRQGAPRKR